jgi:hypothetical protein
MFIVALLSLIENNNRSTAARHIPLFAAILLGGLIGLQAGASQRLSIARCSSLSGQI